MDSESRELLASREDVWGFLAEPNHLSDWWPGLVGVEADRRGFAPGTRWRVTLVEGHRGLFGLPASGRLTGPRVDHTLQIGEIADGSRWSWRLIPTGSRTKAARTIDVTITLAGTAPDRTRVTIAVHGTSFAGLFGSRDRRLARAAANRLYDLVQTAATL
jgi:uncharacterized protein YndB with AHSA1/START domain